MWTASLDGECELVVTGVVKLWDLFLECPLTLWLRLGHGLGVRENTDIGPLTRASTRNSLFKSPVELVKR